MGSSLPLWVLLLGVPFLPLTVAARGTVATGLIIVAEVAFWGGAALAGPEAAKRIRSWWRRSHETHPSGTTPDPASGIPDPESRIVNSE